MAKKTATTDKPVKAKKATAKKATGKKATSKKAVAKKAPTKKAAKEAPEEKGAEKEPAKKKPAKRAPRRPKEPVEIRLKAMWGVFNQSVKEVATYEYFDRKAAEKKCNDLSKSGKSPHFIRKVKREIEEEV